MTHSLYKCTFLLFTKQIIPISIESYTDTCDGLVALNDREVSLVEAAPTCGMIIGNTFHMPLTLSLVKLF